MPTVDALELGFDPGDPAFIAEPYGVFARLRAAGRVVPDASSGLALLPHHADVHAALRHRGLGRVAHGGTRAAPAHPRWEQSERWSLLNLEPPDHTRIRRLVSSVFTARAVAALRPLVEELADRHLARAVADSALGELDLVADYAQPFSIDVICRWLGVPVEDGPLLLGWSHAIVKMYELRASPLERERAERAADEFIDHVERLICARRSHPRDDVISALLAAVDAGEHLTEDEIVSTVIVLLNAGHEATVNTLGNGMRTALAHPSEWARVRSGEVSPATAVEELVRHDAPLQLFERWVRDEVVELAGHTFVRGERLGLLFGSANRDPARFADPDRFDIGRGDAGHIGFGGGVHFCIGAPLARLELEASVTRLAGLGEALRPVGETAYQPFFVIRGLQSLPVTVA
ncbi:MAG: cytochrome P450 [Actinomycetota bacterium]|nr:cytochrome P450 [Actinomycetota bacterium]